MTRGARIVNGFPVKRMPLSRLKPADWNPRMMKAAELDKLRRSVETFGLVEPIIWNERSGQIVGGHQRVKVLLAAGTAETDVIVVDLDELQESQLNLSLNRISGDWDEDALRELIQSLQEHNADLSLTGFDDDEISDLLDDMEAVTIERELSEEQTLNLNQAWQEWARDTLKFIELLSPHGVVSHNCTRAIARIYFLRALYLGERYPRWTSHAFHPRQIHVAGHAHSMIDALKSFTEDLKYGDSFRFCLKDKPSIDMILAQSLPIGGSRTAPDFPAELALDLINEFCPVGGAVLDPCHGWGGRLVGFLLSRASSYTGFDPAESTHAGTKALFENYSRYTPGKEAKFFCQCFEDSQLEAESFDFALTSPPYFNVEKYEGENSSFRKFKKFDAWDNGFYHELIHRTAKALKPNAVFALQVGNQTHPLEKRAKDHAKSCGLEYVETRASGMINNWTETPEDEGEVVVLFQKIGL
ncbi:ParB N-terminal domain-containing protein [bacterium]|nr:ParB N-terminal domain-containing protein [bacterium]